MARAVDVPKFGPLQGVRVINAAKSTAGGFCSSVLAEMGADVIWCESPQSLDPTRAGAGEPSQAEHRNMRNICFSTPTPEGREILFGLLKDADIFFESSKGDHYAHKWGMTDEFLWSINPKLVIIHLSGFGQTGLDEFVTRGSYDPIAQAFSGLMQLQGYPGDEYPPQPAHMSVADYLAALHATVGGLAALNRTLDTGKGESVDVCQYECALRCQAQRPGEYWNYGVKPFREGYLNKTAACWGIFETSDNRSIYIIGLGVSPLKILCKLLGFTYGEGDIPEGTIYINRYETETGKIFQERWIEYCKTHTAQEIEDALLPHGVTCSKVNNYEDLLNDEGLLEHGTLFTGTTADGRDYVQPCIAPRFKKNPTWVWRPMPGIGADNNDILRDLGYTTHEIKELYEKKVIVRKPPVQITKEVSDAIIKSYGYGEDQMLYLEKPLNYDI